MADLNSTLVRGKLGVVSDTNIGGNLVVGGNVTASKFNNYTISGSVGANTIPVRDGNGYVYFNYINTNVGTDNSASGSSTFLYTNSDGWIRKADAATFRAAIGAGTSSLAIGTTASTAAAGNHTHTTSIASGGTSQISLAANTAYTLTAGGTTYVFTTPPDSNTWRPIGSGAADAAAGNHKHAVTASGTVALSSESSTANGRVAYLAESSFTDGVLTLVTKYMAATFTGSSVDTGVPK